MRPDFALPNFPALACVLLLVSGSAGAQETASQPDRSWPKYATARGGKLRGLPDLAAPAVRDLKVGEPLVVVGRQDQLYEVEVPGGMAVWVYAAYVRDGKETGTVDTIEDSVNLRPEPRSDARAVPIARAKKGTHLVMLGREGDWIQVAAPAEIHGFVPGSDLEITNDPPSARAAEIAAAQKWVENMRAEAAQKDAARRADVERKQKEDAEAREALKKETEARNVCNQGLELLRGMPDQETRDRAGALFTEAAAMAAALPAKNAEAVNAEVKRARDLSDTIAFHEREKREAQEKLEAEAADAKRRADEAVRRADETLARHGDPKPVDAFGARFAGNGLGMGWMRRDLEIPRGWIYKIERGGKLLFYVTCPSGKYNLDHYLGREVGIIGSVKQIDGYPARVIEVEKIEILSNTNS